jgi:hypothetical protein
MFLRIYYGYDHFTLFDIISDPVDTSALHEDQSNDVPERHEGLATEDLATQGLATEDHANEDHATDLPTGMIIIS